MELETTLDEEKVFQQLKMFSEVGDKLIKELPEVIEFLKQQEYIRYMPTTIHSISALLEGRSSSTNVDHYVWTLRGIQEHRRLSQRYN